MPSMVLQPLVKMRCHTAYRILSRMEEVVIEVSRLNDEIMISAISDNGTGMPADELEKLILNDFA